MNILCSADLHINLKKKKVPYEWQLNRFKLFFDKIFELEKTHDVHIIAGDVFDTKPEPDEMTLFYYFANRVTVPTYIIDGNHEATSKGKTFLKYFNRDKAINNPNIHIITDNTLVKINNILFQFFPYREMKLNNVPSYTPDSILITHIRGEVPPNITAEFDFEKLRQWKLILLGDLHFYHKYKDFPAYYPSSPLNTSFDRSDDRDYGVISVDFQSIDNYQVKFIPLNLPKLIRKTISSKEIMEPHSFHHIIYEIEGSLDEVATIKQHDLLDKKIIKKPKDNSKIDLSGKTDVEELQLYLEYIKATDIQSIVDEYMDLKIND